MKSTNWKTIAELTGMAAIVASLIFVGVQLRQDREIAQAEALGDYLEMRTAAKLAFVDHIDVLSRANAGEPLSPTDAGILRELIEVFEDLEFLQDLRGQTLGGHINTAELKFALFLYKNPAAREVWLQIDDDMQTYIDPLRSPESLARTRTSGSAVFRARIKKSLQDLDETHGAHSSQPRAGRVKDFGARYTAAWNSGDPSKVAAMYEENGALIPNGNEQRGRAAIAEFAGGFMEAFPDMQLIMDEVVLERDRSIYHWTFIGSNTGPGGTGNAVNFSGYEEWSFGDSGLIRESQGHFDANEYQRQVEQGIGDGS